MRPAEIYRTLFCQMYGVRSPAVVLGEVIHWWAIVRDAGLADLTINKQVGYVPEGYFYATHVEAPSDRAVRDAFADAGRHDADWVLYPVVRAVQRSEAMREAGFLPVPWFVEAEYRMRDGVDVDLRAQLGKSRHGDLRRASRRAAERYPYEVRGPDQVDEESLAAFDRLHRINLSKYGHKHNHLSPTALRLILDSPIGSGVRLFLRRQKEGGEPVQAGLNLLDEAGGTMAFVAQGIDREHMPAGEGQNLYKAWFYDMYQWGAAHGVDAFTLGRGAELNKLDVGGNTFYLLDNHLAPTRCSDPQEVDALRARLTLQFAGVRHQLAEAVTRRRAASHVVLHW